MKRPRVAPTTRPMRIARTRPASDPGSSEVVTISRVRHAPGAERSLRADDLERKIADATDGPEIACIGGIERCSKRPGRERNEDVVDERCAAHLPSRRSQRPEHEPRVVKDRR